jgi:hypothetical protein
MLKAILLAMLMVTVLSIGSIRNAPAIFLDLAQFQWKNRLLFLFAPNRNHPFFGSLHRALVAQQAEVVDRDLVIFEILESGPSTMSTTHLDPQTAQSLREKFEVRQGEFTVILIGKDGGIKLSRQNQTRLEDIFGLIDTMPMRREEMRQKSRTKESVADEPNKSGGNQ